MLSYVRNPCSLVSHVRSSGFLFLHVRLYGSLFSHISLRATCSCTSGLLAPFSPMSNYLALCFPTSICLSPYTPGPWLTVLICQVPWFPVLPTGSWLPFIIIRPSGTLISHVQFPGSQFPYVRCPVLLCQVTCLYVSHIISTCSLFFHTRVPSILGFLSCNVTWLPVLPCQASCPPVLSHQGS